MRDWSFFIHTQQQQQQRKKQTNEQKQNKQQQKTNSISGIASVSLKEKKQLFRKEQYF